MFHDKLSHRELMLLLLALGLLPLIGFSWGFNGYNLYLADRLIWCGVIAMGVGHVLFYPERYARFVVITIVLGTHAWAYALPLWTQFAKTVTLFYAPLNSNGMTAADPASSWPAELTALGVTAPQVAWWADDPTGSGGKTTHAFTETGSTTEVDTPFCPDGSWSDLTSGCLKARRFDGATDYYSSNADDVADIADGDSSVCVLVRLSTTLGGTDTIMGNREGTAGEGWRMTSDGTSFKTYVENHAGTEVSPQWNNSTALLGNWYLTCSAMDFDGNLVPYAQGASDTAEAMPGGVINTASSKFDIGSLEGSGLFTGDIAAVFFWNSLLTDTQVADLFEYFTGILDEKGAPVAFTNTGPNCCWVDGAIECFGDDWPMLGCELPPGITGAGSPSSEYYSGESLTNSIPYSRDLSSWGVVAGTPTPTATSTDLFRDGRQTYKITDNDGAGSEQIYNDVSISGLSNGDTVIVCLWAKGSDSNQKLDAYFRELSGTCSGGATNYSATPVSLTTSWSSYSWAHQIQDDTCDLLRPVFCPGNAANACGDAAALGDAEFVVQVFLDQDWCPPIYIETAAAAVTGGDDLDAYTISGTSMAAGIADGTVITFNFTPAAATVGVPETAQLVAIEDTGTGVDYYRINWNVTNNKLYVEGRSTESGPATMYSSTAVWVPTAGTAYAFEVVIDAAATTVSIDGTPVAGGNNTLATGPNSLDYIRAGGILTGIRQPNGWVSEVKVTR